MPELPRQETNDRFSHQSRYNNASTGSHGMKRGEHSNNYYNYPQQYSYKNRGGYNRGSTYSYNTRNRGGYYNNTYHINQAHQQYHSYHHQSGYDTYRNGYNNNHNTYLPPNSAPIASPTSTPLQSSRYLSSGSSISKRDSRPSTPADIDNSKACIEIKDSAFLYLTGLNKSTQDKQELEKICRVFLESDEIDNKLEQQKLDIWKTELELGLLNTQSEKDSLNVQLTQENLDSLLME